MAKFEIQKFDIPELIGISKTNIEEHLKLYEGYVKHSNMVIEKINELYNKGEENMGLISGLQKRFGFEYNGMRNHEVYFKLFEGGHKDINQSSNLYNEISLEWGSFEKWLENFKNMATIRGIGWAILYFDKKENRLLNTWVDEQHLGQLQNCTPILALDMWEHSYVYDFMPSGKKKYIESFFTNINWEVIEENYKNARV